MPPLYYSALFTPNSKKIKTTFRDLDQPDDNCTFFRSDHSDFVDYRMLSLLPALLSASLRWAAHPPSLLCLLSPSLSEIVLGKSHHRSQHSPFVRLLKSIMKSGRCFWSHTTPSGRAVLWVEAALQEIEG